MDETKLKLDGVSEGREEGDALVEGLRTEVEGARERVDELMGEQGRMSV